VDLPAKAWADSTVKTVFNGAIEGRAFADNAAGSADFAHAAWDFVRGEDNPSSPFTLILRKVTHFCLTAFFSLHKFKEALALTA
jgi:hypothetical protein